MRIRNSARLTDGEREVLGRTLLHNDALALALKFEAQGDHDRAERWFTMACNREHAWHRDRLDEVEG